MINSLDPSADRFLNDLARVQRRTDRAARQMASGVRVSTASDAPADIAGILRLHASIARNQQIQSNLGRVKTEVDGAEQALQAAVRIMDRAAVLTSQSTGPLQTPETRAALVAEVAGLQQQMIAISATQVEGRYVFGGDRDETAPYEPDNSGTAPNGVVAVTAAPATRQVEDASGTLFPAGKTAAEIFDHGSGSVFATLNSLRTALENGDVPALTSLNATVRDAGSWLNEQLSFYGATQSRIAAATSSANTLELQLKTELSGREDTDLSEAVLEMQQGMTQQQAALTARAKLPRSSLFDLLG
jgi:flagellar hook-associated protein 3 FlgL